MGFWGEHLWCWYASVGMFFYGLTLANDKEANAKLERETFRGAATVGAVFMGATWPVWLLAGVVSKIKGKP